MTHQIIINGTQISEVTYLKVAAKLGVQPNELKQSNKSVHLLEKHQLITNLKQSIRKALWLK